MRVAYVCADIGVPVFGHKGCSIHVQEVVRALARDGADVHLMAAHGLDGPRPAGLEHLPVHALPQSREADPAAREQAAWDANTALRVMLDRIGPFDTVYERHSLWSIEAMRFARVRGMPSVLEVNAPLIREQADYRTLHDLDRAVRATEIAFRMAPTIVAVSEGVADYVRQFTGVTARLHVVPNGVDPSRFAPTARAQRADASAPFTIGFVGSLKPWHGLPVLVDAFAALHAEHPRTRLLIVGDGPERIRLETQVASQRLSGAVELTGAVPWHDIPAALASMHVGVAPYGAQPGFYFSPLKVLEYMAAGLPVVVSRVGQLQEFVADGATGRLCTPGDATDLATALRQVRDDPALARRLGDAARTEVERRHTWTATVRRIFALAGVTLPANSAGRPARARAHEGRG